MSALAAPAAAAAAKAASAAPADEEARLRQRLGIPADAERVLIFGETSHWDPNWLLTSEEYYERRIEPILDAVIAELQREPERVFSLESIFFLRLYWQRQPESRGPLRTLLNSGRLRITGTGITTPDTVLPSSEALLRDYLLGQQWLREQGITQQPRLAYLPDDFGYSPALPTIFRALGVEMLGITRVDGMYFVGCDYRRRSAFPLPGSSADLLQRELATQDFIWRAPDGAEALCHWNAYTYFQGDMLAYQGVIRWMGRLYGWPWRTEAHIARRIRRYVRDLGRFARTPYLFCPIGCDFNEPIPGLLELLRRYNRHRFETTGIWVLSAGLDDYLKLVQCHRDKLPTVALDPNPYWMGFYASRPEAKVRCNRVVRKLVLAEKLTAIAEAEDDAGGAKQRSFDGSMRAAWEAVVLSNHHDYITGTSPDRVWFAEQRPALYEAEAQADAALARALFLGNPTAAEPATAIPRWSLIGGRLTVETDCYQLELDERAGGCIVSYRTAAGEELCSGPANDLVAYRDSGGLWRLGHEFRGGVFRAVRRASEEPATIDAVLRGDLLEVRVTSELGGAPMSRLLWLRCGSPVLRLQLSGIAPHRRTITIRVPLALETSSLTMNVPGGVIERPRHKIYTPTFWPARSFVHLRDETSGRGVAAFLGGPAGVALGDDGALECLAFRNAPREMAYGLLPVLAHPARGTEVHQATVDYALLPTAGGDFRENLLPQRVRRALREAIFDPGAVDVDDVANSFVVTDHPDVLVAALKPASCGTGLIARLRSYSPTAREVQLRCPRRPIRAAVLCDACERDLVPITVEDGAARVPLSASISSVRLHLEVQATR